jgi:hypothetical protein
MTESQRPTAKVLFRVPNEDGSAEVETLWAHVLGADRYRIDNCPYYAYGVSWNDVVHAPFDPVEGFPTFRSVLTKSGNRTIRVILDPPAAPGNESEKMLSALVSLGCSCERATQSYIAVNIPPSVDLGGVVDFLTKSRLTWEHADPTYNELHPVEPDQR